MITLPSEIATSAGMFVFAIVQALILLVLAPLFSGISRMIRARIQSRRGPGVLQDYRDIAKLMKRQNIWPDNAGWVSKALCANQHCDGSRHELAFIYPCCTIWRWQ